VSLPEPYYHDEDSGITIFHADCREILPLLEPGSIDLVLTDPPYGIGIAANPFRQKHERSTWDDARPTDSLIAETVAFGKHAIVWGGNYFDLPPTQRFFVWDKVQPEDFSSAMCEMAWSNIPGPAKMFKRHVVSYEKEPPNPKASGTYLRRPRSHGRVHRHRQHRVPDRLSGLARHRVGEAAIPWQRAQGEGTLGMTDTYTDDERRAALEMIYATWLRGEGATP
jgi:hypothetical protein